MSATLPTREPTKVLQNTTEKWTKDLPAYLPADGWALRYYLATAADEATVEATDNGDGRFLVTLSQAVTLGMDVGVWTWDAIVSKDGEAFRVGTGTLEVEETITGAGSGVERRTLARRTLAAIEAVLLGRASETDLSYQIAGRSLAKFGHDELIRARRYWRREVEREERAELRANGYGSGGLVRMRFR